ncbi:MAG: Ig-like domain-containing protein [Bacilli bacterium]|nr:Ig-like domain-containing protein [Bacilli bacterium]
MLYAGQLSQYYEDLQLKIGDSVHVKGVNSPYGGFNEIKPSEITKEIQGNLAKPNVLTVSGEDYADAEHKLLGKDSNLAKVTNAVYKSGTITVANKVHNNLIFGFPKTDGSLVDVAVAVSYHLGTDALNALKAVTDTLKPGDKVNLDGNISVNENKFQFALNFLEGKTPAQCVVPTGESQTLAQPESIKITAADDVKELEVGKKLQLSAEVTPADAVQTVKWSSSDATIAKVGEDTGLVEGIGQGKVTITATSTVLDTVKATFELDVKENNDPYDIVSNPEVNVAYRLGLYQENLSKAIYSDGKESGNYLATTENIGDGADWYVEDVSKEGDAEKTYKLYTQDDETKKYLNLVDREYTSQGQQKISHDPKLQDEGTTIWKFNTEYNTFTTEVGTDGEMYLGTYNSFNTLSMSKISYAKTSFVSHFMSIRPKLVKEAPKVDTPYLLGLSQDNLNKNLFFVGEMDGYYYKTTASAQFAKNIYFESATGGYYMYFKGEASAKKYLNYVQTDETHKGVVLADTAVSVWTYNSEHNTMTTVLQDVTYYLGTYGTYNTISASAISKIGTSFPTHLFESVIADDSGETPDTPDTPVEDPKTFVELTKTDVKVTDWKAVVTHVAGKNVYLDDGTAGILAFCKEAASGISVGDYVKVSGTTSTYNAAIQIADAEVTKLTEGTPNELCAINPLTQAKAKELFDAKSTVPGGRYSLRTGAIGGSGNYLTWAYGEINMETGANATAGMQAGKIYDVEGYVQGIYKSQYLLFVVTKATVVETELTSLTCKASADKVKVDEEITLSAEGNAGADVSNVTFQITEGSDKATINGNKLKGVAEGTVKVVAKCGSVTSEPITITVEKKEEQGGETPTVKKVTLTTKDFNVEYTGSNIVYGNITGSATVENQSVGLAGYYANYGNGLQMNKESFLCNTSAFPGYITEIKINWNSNTTTTKNVLIMSAGTTAMTSLISTGTYVAPSAVTTSSFDASDKITYFNLSHHKSTSGAVYIDSIEISYSVVA